MKTHGQGSIVKLEDKEKRRCRKWQLRVSVGRDKSQSGKYVTKTRRFAGTYTEAQKALSEFISELERKEYSFSDYTTVKNYIEMWEERRKTQGLSSRTLESESYKLKNVSLNIGNLYLKDLRPDHIEKLYYDLANGSSVSGRCLKPKTIHDIHKSLITMLKAADYDGLVDRKLLHGIKAPKQTESLKIALNSEQITEFINKLDISNYFQLGLLLCITTGIRRSECLALQWNDIRNDVMYVSRSLDEHGKVKLTKNRKVRAIPLPQTTKSALEQEQRRQKTIGYYRESGRIISRLGEYLTPHAFSTWFRRNRKKLGLEGYTIHELRHTYITELARKGVHPKIAQELAGHASIETTMDIYSHVDLDDKKEAVSRLNF